MTRPAPPRAARRAVAVTFIAHGLISGAWAPRIPEVKAHLHLSAGSLGIALLAPALAALLAGRWIGRIVHREGSPTANRQFVLLFYVVAWLPGIAWNLGSLFVTLLLWGASLGALDVAMNAQGVTVETRYGRPILSSFHAMWSIGSFLGALVGGIGIALHLHIAVQQAIVAAIAVSAVLIASRRFVPDQVHAAEPEPSHHHKRRRLRLPQRRLLLLGFAGICAMLSEGAVADWSGVLLRDHLHVTGGLVSSGLVAFSVLMTAGRLIGDRAIHALGRQRCLAGCALLGAAGLGAGLLVDRPVPTVIGFGVLGLGLSIMVPVIYSTAADTGGPHGPALAVVASLGFGGTLFGPSLIGFVAEGTSVHLALGLLPPLTLLAGVLSVIGVRLTQRSNGQRGGRGSAVAYAPATTLHT